MFLAKHPLSRNSPVRQYKYISLDAIDKSYQLLAIESQPKSVKFWRCEPVNHIFLDHRDVQIPEIPILKYHQRLRQSSSSIENSHRKFQEKDLQRTQFVEMLLP